MCWRDVERGGREGDRGETRGGIRKKEVRGGGGAGGGGGGAGRKERQQLKKMETE